MHLPPYMSILKTPFLMDGWSMVWEKRKIKNSNFIIQGGLVCGDLFK